jgi:RNA polymerase sigma factor (sigma-70 family)
MDLTETDLRAHVLWLQRLAMRLVASKELADDAVQDTLVAALRHPPALDRDVRPWLARVLANLTRSDRRAELRRRSRETALASQDAEAPPGADDLLVRHEAARVVAGLVSALREPHRGLVLLRFAEGLTPKQIAVQRRAPEGTIRRQLKEAVDQLRGAVAAHYQRDARDWRRALLPLAGLDRPRAAPTGAWTEGALIMAKSKTGLGVAAAAVLLAVVLALLRWGAGGRDRQPEAAAVASQPMARQGEGRERVLRERGGAPPAGGTAPTVPAPAPPPKLSAIAPADPSGCPARLAELRARASQRALLSPAAFDGARPSPTSERQVAPIVERVIGKLPDKPSYQLECRASVCRVGAVTDPTASREPPRWLQALSKDEELTALRGSNQSTRAESVSTRDALTSAALLQHWIYFTVPLAAGEEHPFEASANATTCGERVAAIQRALDEQRDRDQQRRQDEKQRLQQFQAMPVNVELTRRIEAALRPVMEGKAGGLAGVWECRGQRECRWRGPAGAARAATPPELSAALATQGLSADQVMARLRGPKDDGSKEPEAELTLRLGDGDKPERGPTAGGRSQVIQVERTTAEPDQPPER